MEPHLDMFRLANMLLGGPMLANAFSTGQQKLCIFFGWLLRWRVSFQALIGLDEFADNATEEVGSYFHVHFFSRQLRLNSIPRILKCLFPFQRWLYEFNQDQWRRDAFSLLLGTVEISLGNIGFIIKHRSDDAATTESVRLLHVITAATLVQHIAVGTMLLKRKWVLGRRDQNLVVVYLLRFFLYYHYIMSSPLFLSMQPYNLPKTAIGLTFHLCFLPLILTRASFALLTPLKSWLIFGLFGNSTLLYFNFTRCTKELAVLPTQGQRYRDIIVSLERVWYRFFPLAPATEKTFGSLLAGHLSDRGSCIAVRSWCQVRLGGFE